MNVRVREKVGKKKREERVFFFTIYIINTVVILFFLPPTPTSIYTVSYHNTVLRTVLYDRTVRVH